MKPYCTYVTIYSGNKLPPFYIGYVRTKRILEQSYHGSVCSRNYKQIWEQELKENPQLFKTNILSYYNTAKEAHEKELFLQRKMNVITNPLYINKAIGVYCDNTGRKHSLETRHLWSRKGKNNGMYGKHHTEEVKQLISDINTGKKRTPEHIAIIVATNKRSYEERYGIEKANKLKLSRSSKHMNIKNCVCEHYCIITTKGNYTRWHGNRCKYFTP
jgi:hypothetical protein